MKRLIFALVSAGLLLGCLQATRAQIIHDVPQDGLVENNGIIDKEPIPLPYIRQADVMWSKRIWRVIDFREKMNQSFYYPVEPQNNWRNFTTIILDALKEGSITAYDISATDEFLVTLNYQGVINRQVDTISRVLRRPYPPYDEYDTTIYTEFDPSKVMALSIKEDWYFDKQRSQMMVRIIGLCPVMMKERDGQEIPEPLFWVYYQEARPVLAKALMFNRQNNAERRSYDEVFWKRMFSSYIYKEQNVYDRRISEYATGIDALLESERIKNSLFGSNLLYALCEVNVSAKYKVLLAIKIYLEYVVSNSPITASCLRFTTLRGLSPISLVKKCRVYFLDFIKLVDIVEWLKFLVINLLIIKRFSENSK